MAHAGRPASRHGTYDAFRNEFASENATDELPSQSMYSYDASEDVRQTGDSPTVRNTKQRSARSRTMSHGVLPSGPVVAVHMFDVPSDKSDSSDTSQPQTQGLRRWSREALDGSSAYPPASPRPPSTPRSSRPGSRRRSLSGQRPSSTKGQGHQRPGSRKSSRDYSLEQEELLPPMATLRPQSSLGKYSVLPSISPTGGDKLVVDYPVTSSRSDGSEDQRGSEEMDHLVSRMAQHSVVGGEASRIGSSIENSLDTAAYRETRHFPPPSEHSVLSQPNSELSATTTTTTTAGGKQHHPAKHYHHRDSSASSTSTEPVNDRSHTSLSQYRMEDAPKPASEGLVLLGIKIPTDGTRHKHYFHPRDQLRCIVLFAEEVSGEDFSNHILVLATPRHQRFDNLSQTIEAAGLQSKSVLHLDELD